MKLNASSRLFAWDQVSKQQQQHVVDFTRRLLHQHGIKALVTIKRPGEMTVQTDNYEDDRKAEHLLFKNPNLKSDGSNRVYDEKTGKHVYFNFWKFRGLD